MGKIVPDISMSLDGFVTGPNADVERGTGVGGEPLHHWVHDGKTQTDAEVLDELIATTGAVVMGRRTFDFVDGPNGWDNDLAFGGERGERSLPPNFVLTHTVSENVGLRSAFTFVTGGIESVVERAKAAAGDKDVSVMGGANVIQQCIKAGLADEIVIHLAPVLLGEGIRLFKHAGAERVELERIRVIESPGATYLRFRVMKEAQ